MYFFLCSTCWQLCGGSSTGKYCDEIAENLNIKVTDVIVSVRSGYRVKTCISCEYLPTAYVVRREDYALTRVCLSVHTWGGIPARSRGGTPARSSWGVPTLGTPPSDLAGGTPMGGTPPQVPPLLDLAGEVTPNGGWYPTLGTPHWTWLGGTPTGGYPTLGNPPHRTWPGGYPT